jgi:hypothetical protein
MPVRTFVPFSAADDIVVANQTTVTLGLWSNDTGSLTAFYSSSDQVTGNSGKYYFDVYNKATTDATSEVQFAVAYGHINGGGSPTLLQNEQSTLATQATYLQYKNILLGPTDDLFTFGTHKSSHIYIINIERARLREQFDPGNWQLTLSGSQGSFTFIDDSGQTLSAKSATAKSGRVFNVVSGSLSGVSGSTIPTGSASQSVEGGTFGLVYPDVGIIVLNPDALVPTVGFYSASGNFGCATAAGENFYYSSDPTNVGRPFAPYTGSLTGNYNEQYNHAGLVRAIVQGGEFNARSAETISSTHYFVRLRNKDFNYSNNPTFYNNTNGQILTDDFVQDPHVYITTIGLYNDNSELLAVAKVSSPLEKTFDKEALVRVRLDF